jgi:peroxiredoxin
MKMMKSKFATLATAGACAWLVLAAGCRGEQEAEPAPETESDEAAAQQAEAEDAEDAEDEKAAPETAEVGSPAPAFTLPGADGESYGLEDFRGQWVVLEWINHDCPAVRKFYEPGKMQELQATYTDPDGAGAAWLSIASSAPGKQGHEAPDRWLELTEEKEAQPTAVLIDEDGQVGRAYGARTTPHMYIIDPEGTLVYHGAIDSVSSTDSGDIEGAENYVQAVLDAALAGEEPPVTYRDPYGCSIKYGDA